MLKYHSRRWSTLSTNKKLILKINIQSGRWKSRRNRKWNTKVDTKISMQDSYYLKERFRLLNNRISVYKTTKMNPKVQICMNHSTTNWTTLQLRTQNSILLWSKAYFYRWRAVYFHIKICLNDNFIIFVLSIRFLHTLVLNNL